MDESEVLNAARSKVLVSLTWKWVVWSKLVCARSSSIPSSLRHVHVWNLEARQWQTVAALGEGCQRTSKNGMLRSNWAWSRLKRCRHRNYGDARSYHWRVCDSFTDSIEYQVLAWWFGALGKSCASLRQVFGGWKLIRSLGVYCSD